MRTILERFVEAADEFPCPIAFTIEDLQAVASALEAIRCSAEYVRPDLMCGIERHAAHHVKKRLIETAKKIGVEWRQNECRLMHTRYEDPGTIERVCLLCGKAESNSGVTAIDLGDGFGCEEVTQH